MEKNKLIELTDLVDKVHKASALYPEGVEIIGTEKAFKRLVENCPQYAEGVVASSTLTHLMGYPVHLTYWDEDVVYVVRKPERPIKVVYTRTNIDCNCCVHLNITEREQREKHPELTTHCCLLYKDRVLHMSTSTGRTGERWHSPWLHPCDECKKDEYCNYTERGGNDGAVK